MTSALDSHFGLAKQTAKGSENTTDAEFQYFYFSEGPGVSPVPIVVPLDQEIGSGSLIRNVKRLGVSSGGSVSMIPRAESIGWLLLGALGTVSTVTSAGYNTHTFKFGSNEFTTPYFTIRRRTTALGGEIAPDVRVAGLSFNFAAADFLRADAAFVGAGLPKKADTASWDPTSYLDPTPEFVTANGSLSLAGESLKVLRGSLAIGNNMPLDEQFIVGSLTPDDIEMVSRAIVMQATVKADADLYTQLMYDSAGGNNWTTGILKDASLSMSFESTEVITGATKYSLEFHANEEAAAGTPNIAWSVEPVVLRGNRQVLMNVTATVLADNASYADGPFSVKLVNTRTSY